MRCDVLQTVINDFVRAINAHDPHALDSLMSDDHVFIDAHGNEMHGRDTMHQGWAGYFQLFPDYTIEIHDMFGSGETVALFGSARGTFNGTANSWKIPVAWKAVVRNGRVALWQVFGDTKLPFESMKTEE